MIVVIGLVLLLENLLKVSIVDIYLRTILIIMIALGLHYFLSTSLLEHYQQREENLQKMIDETLHELNTPIATIQANLSMLKKSNTDPKNLKRLLRIEHASDNLTSLYESIEHSIKSDISLVEKEVFDIQELIDSCITKVSDIQGDIIIENKLNKKLIYIDKKGFKRTIDNILHNAIKYNKKDGFVKFYMQRNQLYIQDSGQGIDTKNLFIIFEKSFQENPATNGYGLGLGIVKSFCDKEKIEVKIDTIPLIGTTIMMDLSEVIT